MYICILLIYKFCVINKSFVFDFSLIKKKKKEKKKKKKKKKKKLEERKGKYIDKECWDNIIFIHLFQKTNKTELLLLLIFKKGKKVGEKVRFLQLEQLER